MSGVRAVVAVAALLVGCSGAAAQPRAPVPRLADATVMRPLASQCGGAPLAVHFYDVGQALSVLLELPDGRRVLVDAGDSATRPGCGVACGRWSAHLLEALERDLGARDLDAVWITHQHADHLGGVPALLAARRTALYVDNGTALRRAMVRAARGAAAHAGAALVVVDPAHRQSPLPNSAGVELRAIVPPAWPARCDKHPNDCSIGLRVDYCASSVLLQGDAERAEEAVLDPGGPVDLLGVGHHGSDTSSSPDWLARLQPHYAVISVGHPGEGTNQGYCHPRAAAVARVSRAIGGSGRPLQVFRGSRCRGSSPSDWTELPASQRLWATSRDGDVVLVSRGDGAFVRSASIQR